MEKLFFLLVWGLIVAVFLFLSIRKFAIDSLSELRYMLKCSKERREYFSDGTELAKECDIEIHNLEEKISKHWGRIFRNKKGVFDVIPTHKEGLTADIIRNTFK